MTQARTGSSEAAASPAPCTARAAIAPVASAALRRGARLSAPATIPPVQAAKTSA